jgi:hypothetical protein
MGCSDNCHDCGSEKFSTIVELKEAYLPFMEKYSLPGFTDLNRVFDIEDIDTETEFFIRKIRRLISERMVAYLRFVEMVLNPSIAPMFFFTAIKKLDNGDKERLMSIQDSLGKFEIEVIELDIDYNEQKEAEFINKIYTFFNNELKCDLLMLVHKLGNGKDQKKCSDSDTYFG